MYDTAMSLETTDQDKAAMDSTCARLSREYRARCICTETCTSTVLRQNILSQERKCNVLHFQQSRSNCLQLLIVTEDLIHWQPWETSNDYSYTERVTSYLQKRS